MLSELRKGIDLQRPPTPIMSFLCTMATKPALFSNWLWSLKNFIPMMSLRFLSSCALSLPSALVHGPSKEYIPYCLFSNLFCYRYFAIQLQWFSSISYPIKNQLNLWDHYYFLKLFPCAVWYILLAYLFYTW